ncbi:MAG: hypothetical protein MZV65_35675 [Chromatiales bacterium]|nr:hypothetical protein [Chromatiales bacterium]
MSEVLSAVLYPKVFLDFHAGQMRHGDVSVLPTSDLPERHVPRARRSIVHLEKGQHGGGASLVAVGRARRRGPARRLPRAERRAAPHLRRTRSLGLEDRRDPPAKAEPGRSHARRPRRCPGSSCPTRSARASASARGDAARW